MAATGTLKVDGQTIAAQTVLNEYITITKRLNAHSTMVFDLIDKEGALYGTDIGGGTNWEDSQGKTVTFQHSDNTYNFVGRIEKLIFYVSKLHVECVGASIAMREYSLAIDEANFIQDTGYVNGDPTNYQGVVCDEKDSEGNDQDFTWDVNFSLYTERDIGVVFTATTGLKTKTWEASAISTTGATSTTGNVAWIQSEDVLQYEFDDDGTLNAYTDVTMTVDGADEILSSADFKSIEIYYFTSCLAGTTGTVTVSLQIYNYDTSSYETLGTIFSKDRVGLGEVWTVMKESLFVNDNITDYLDDSDTDGSYDQIKLRWLMSGTQTGAADASCHINYVSATISYEDYSYDPIMAKVYGNDASTLYLTDGVYDDGSYEWTGTTGGANAEVTEDYDFWMGHADVWKLVSTGDVARVYREYSPAEEVETFQFWVNLADTAATFQCKGETAASYAWNFYTSGGKFYMDGVGAAQDLGAFSADTWYHVEIVWATTAGGGDGLDVEIDSVNVYSESPGLHDDDGVDKIQYTLSSSHTVYVDAIGSNGDGDYSTDDNKVPTGGIASYTSGVRDNDSFVIGDSTRTVIHSLLSKIPSLGAKVDENFDRYYPRQSIGKSIESVIREICVLEGASWFEEYDSDGNCNIGLYKNDDFPNSDYKDNSHAITTANYEWDFGIERNYNHYKAVRVFGNPNFSIEQYVEDASSTSTRVKTIIDEGIVTDSEAYHLAYNELQTIKTVQNSIILTIEDDYVQQLDVGKDVQFTCARPTLTGTYPIRRIDYNYGFPKGKVTAKVYLGLGSTPPIEKQANLLYKSLELARKTQTDKLNPSNVIGTPAFSHSSLSNVTASQHHTAYTDTDADARIAVHASDVDAHIGAAMYTAILEDALPLGETYKCWYPCTPAGNSASTYKYKAADGLAFSNLDGTDGHLNFLLLKPTNTASHHLMVDAVQIDTWDADDGTVGGVDEITDVKVFATDWDTATVHFNEALPNQAGTADIDEASTVQLEFADRGGSPGDLNCTNYEYVWVICYASVVDARDLDLMGVKLRCWYEAD